MKKRVLYYLDKRGVNPVWDFISALPPDERDKCFEYIAYLEEMGEQIAQYWSMRSGRKQTPSLAEK